MYKKVHVNCVMLDVKLVIMLDMKTGNLKYFIYKKILKNKFIKCNFKNLVILVLLVTITY